MKSKIKIFRDILAHKEQWIFTFDRMTIFLVREEMEEIEKQLFKNLAFFPKHKGKE